MDPQATVTIAPLTLTSLMLSGSLGGLLVEAAKIARKLQGGTKPNGTDIAAMLLLTLLGGGVAAIYLGQIASVQIAVQVGATAPAIIGAWASGGASAAPRATAPGGSKVRRALSWNTSSN